MNDAFQWKIILDIILTGIIFYGIYYFFRGTHTAAVVKGLFFAVFMYVISSILQLNTLNWVFMKFFNEFPIIIAILFHQEIRQFFSNIGRNREHNSTSQRFSSRLAQSLLELSSMNMGALILVERNMKLHDLLYTGVVLNARYSIELAQAIFQKNSPLHDGAIIIKNERIIAANVLLPVVFTKDVTGTRHGSAISITKERDCTAFVVSEETGAISYVKDGILTTIPTMLIEDVIHEAIK